MSAVALLLLLAVIGWRTASYGSPQRSVPHAAPITVPEGAAERLAAAVRIPTISPEDPAAFDSDAFDALHDYLKTAFPRIHAQLRREIVGRHSLLYT